MVGLAALGARDAMQLQITDTRTLTDENPDIREVEYHNTAVSIGSHSANTLQLPDTEIAAYHGLLLPLGQEQWVFRGTDPQAQTTVNGQAVDGQVELDDGDVLEIGPFTLKLNLEAEPELVLPEARNLEELARIKDFPLPPRSEVRRAEVDVTLTPERRAALVEFDTELRQTLDLARVLEVTLAMLLPQLGARTVWIGVRRKNIGPIEQMVGLNDQGPYTGEPHLWEAFQYRCLSRQQFISIPRTGQKDTQSMLAVPIITPHGALGLIVADTRKHRRVFDAHDLDFATMVASFVGAQLDVIHAGVAANKTELAGQQLALLRAVQDRLDPRNVPQWPHLQIAAFARPGEERGGDFYDIARLPNGLASVLVGHVEAETLRTARVMAEIRSAYRLACMHADAAHAQLRAMNYIEYDEQAACAAHLAIIIMNPKTGAAEYALAGDIRAAVIDARGNPRRLESGAPPVGTTKGYEYSGTRARLQPGETLAFYTAGCAAVRNAEGAELGEERLVEALCDGFGQPATAALAELLADLDPYLKAGTPPDDITVLLVHKLPVEE